MSSTSSIALGQKRKRNLLDFFPSSCKRRATTPPDRHDVPNDKVEEGLVHSSLIEEDDLPTVQATQVPGLSLHHNFITAAEEATLLLFLNNPAKCTWRTDLRRRSMHFGGTYCLFTPTALAPQRDATPAMGHNKENSPGKRIPPPTKPEIIQAPPMAPELDWLLDRFTLQGIFPHGQRPQYLIVNEYHSNLGISAHVENFTFGEPVVGLSLLSPVNMRFHELEKPDGGSVRSGKAAKAVKTGRREDILLKGRSLCVMRAESRWRWQHEICRSTKGRGAGWKRISLTFRYKDGG